MGLLHVFGEHHVNESSIVPSDDECFVDVVKRESCSKVFEVQLSGLLQRELMYFLFGDQKLLLLSLHYLVNGELLLLEDCVHVVLEELDLDDRVVPFEH